MTSTTEKSLQSLLATLRQQHELTLLKLSEPLLAPPEEGKQQYRPSSGAPSGDEQPTPASLVADLAHYKDLFTKLRFSYTEQVTKEKFLRNLVSEPPAHVDPVSNYELEQSLGELKSSLQTQKAEVNALIAELEARSRDLAQRHAAIEEKTAQLQTIPEAMQQLHADISRLREEQGIVVNSADGREEMSLGLEQTVELVEEREEELAHLEARTQSISEQRALREKALNLALEEQRGAERTRDQTVKSAVEAQARRKDGNGGMDEVEARGRWLRGVESTMRNLLEV